MSEDEARKVTAQDEDTDDVEAHGKKIHAGDEGESAEDSDDFEAHRARTNIPKKA
jgi:hypothetical protein